MQVADFDETCSEASRSLGFAPIESGHVTKHRRLRVGIVMHDFALGGTERIALRLASAWADLGADVRIFCGAREGALVTLTTSGVEVIEASPAIRRARGSVRKLGRKAAEYFADRPVDVLFVPGNYHWPIVPAFARLPASVRPVITTQISASLDKPQRGPLRQLGFDWRMRRLLRGADSLVALFDKARQDADRITRSSRTRAIPLPALPNDMVPPAPLTDENVIVAAGRLVPEKGFDKLIDAFAMLGTSTAHLIILGEGPERDNLLERARLMGIYDRFQLAGYASDIRPWLDEARLFVLPSRFEGFPAVIIEALAAGRPVVATQSTSALGALIDDVHIGKLVPVGDVEALADAIATMLEITPASPEQLAKRVAHHRMAPVAQAYLDLFDEMVTLRRAA